MANADFSREQNQTPGGFDSGSYREAKRADEDALHLTPAQQKLAVLENRLPAALRNRGAALALSIVVMLAAFFGLGGAKLKAKYNSASQWFSYGVAADNGYTLNEELLTRLNTAANVTHRTQFVHLAAVRTHHGLVAQHILNRYHCCSALRFPLISAFAAVRLLVFSAFDPITSQARRASRPLLHV